MVARQRRIRPQQPDRHGQRVSAPLQYRPKHLLVAHHPSSIQALCTPLFGCRIQIGPLATRSRCRHHCMQSQLEVPKRRTA